MGKFAENLATYRMQRKLSQEELAKRVGVSQAAIAQYETGASVPRLYVTVKIANALSVKIDELVNGKEDGNEST